MKYMMKNTLSTLFTLLLITMSWSAAIAQESDYEIQQQFRADYNEISAMLENATSSDDLEEVADRVEEFINDYQQHTDMINAAIYPNTASGMVDELRGRYEVIRNNISTIEELNLQVSQLNDELEGFRGQLSDMDSRTAQLQQQLEESQASERQISSLAQQYRESLQERDRFVTNFITDLLQRYEAVDASTSGELQDAAERLDDNPVDLLRTILGEYVNYANQATNLTAPDYLGMRAQHAYFSDWWNDIGERLTEVFDAEEPVQARQEVEDLLANWNSAIDNRIWNALQDAFAENDIQLDNFNSADSFYNALDGYVSNAITDSQERNDEQQQVEYNNFSDYWNNTVKSDWGEYLVAGEVLSYQQISDIDRQLDEWNVSAVPTSNLMLILFLVSLVVIIGLVVALVRKKD